MYDEWTGQDLSILEPELAWAATEDHATQSVIRNQDQVTILPFDFDTRLGVETTPDTTFILWDDFFGASGKTLNVGPLSNPDDLPDGGTVDDIVVTGVRRPNEVTVPDVTLPDIIVVGGGPGGESGGEFTGGGFVQEGLCALNRAVLGLDGNFFGENDGDGIDELVNILTVASFALGFGGFASLAARFAAGSVNSAAFINAVAFAFGDDIALQISNIAFGRIAAASAGAAVATTSFKDLLEAITNGNPPASCGN